MNIGFFNPYPDNLEYIIPHIIADDLSEFEMILIFAAAVFQGKRMLFDQPY